MKIKTLASFVIILSILGLSPLSAKFAVAGGGSLAVPFGDFGLDEQQNPRALGAAVGFNLFGWFTKDFAGPLSFWSGAGFNRFATETITSRTISYTEAVSLVDITAGIGLRLGDKKRHVLTQIGVGPSVQMDGSGRTPVWQLSYRLNVGYAMQMNRRLVLFPHFGIFLTGAGLVESNSSFIQSGSTVSSLNLGVAVKYFL